MTELSRFWNGVSTGDATLAPYDTDEYSLFYSKAFNSHAKGFVIPNYLNELKVSESAPAAASVDVDTGGAAMLGYDYNNDAAVTLTIAANAAGNPRWDAIVLTVDWALQTIRLAVVQGVAGAAPVRPALTQTWGTTWQEALAYVWVDNAFVTIVQEDIWDNRQFMLTTDTYYQEAEHENLVRNGEFMAFSGHATAAANYAPEYWAITEGGARCGLTAWGLVAKPTQQPRGRAISFTIDNAAANPAYLYQTHYVEASTTYTLKMLVYVGSGTMSVGVTPTGAISYYEERDVKMGAWEELNMTFTTGVADTVIQIHINQQNGVAYVGQTMLCQGHHVGKFRQKHEMIMFKYSLLDAAYTGRALVGPGSDNIPMGAGGGNFTELLDDTHAVYVHVEATEGGAGTAQVQVNPLAVSGASARATAIAAEMFIPNADTQAMQGWCYLDPASATPSLYLHSTLNINYDFEIGGILI